MESSAYSKSDIIISANTFSFNFSEKNTDKSVIDLIGFISIGVLLFFGCIFLNYLSSKGK